MCVTTPASCCETKSRPFTWTVHFLPSLILSMDGTWKYLLEANPGRILLPQSLGRGASAPEGWSMYSTNTCPLHAYRWQAAPCCSHRPHLSCMPLESSAAEIDDVPAKGTKPVRDPPFTVVQPALCHGGVFFFQE